jgi:hypothetical protein
VLAGRTGGDDLILFVIDLFARDAGRPASLTDAAELRRDLLLAGPTHRTLEGLRREDDLRRRLARVLDMLPPEARDDPAVVELENAARRGATTVLHLSYRSAPGEAGPESQFDFSRFNLARRKRAGAEDMVRAMDLLRDGGDASDGFVLHHVRR